MVVLRPLRDRASYEAAVRLQTDVWGFSPADAIPWSQMHVVARNGGVVAGAYSGRRLVGFLFSQPGVQDRRPYLYSKMLGVRSSHRGRGIGRSLKRLQRRLALRMGYDRIVWTFDPLERSSAVLNLGYLGVTCPRYETDFYGPDGVGPLHAGLPSDRLVAEWKIKTRRAAERARRRRLPVDVAPPDIRARIDGPGSGRRGSGERVRLPALVAIPPDIQRLKREEPASAARWRSSQRAALRRALARGGEVTDILRVATEHGPRDYYHVTASRAGRTR